MDKEFKILCLNVLWMPLKCRQVKAILEGIIDKEKDSLRIYYLGNNYKNKVEHIGAKKSFDIEGALMF